MKTDAEILEDVYGIIMGSEIRESINGDVRTIPRATGSSSEDCIISILDSDNAQIQDGIVNVNIYVHNIRNGGDSVEDRARTKALSKICETELNSRFGEGFRIYLEKQRVLPVNGKDEHVINNRIRYKFNNE